MFYNIHKQDYIDVLLIFLYSFFQEYNMSGMEDLELMIYW